MQYPRANIGQAYAGLGGQLAQTGVAVEAAIDSARAYKLLRERMKNLKELKQEWRDDVIARMGNNWTDRQRKAFTKKVNLIENANDFLSVAGEFEQQYDYAAKNNIAQLPQPFMKFDTYKSMVAPDIERAVGRATKETLAGRFPGGEPRGPGMLPAPPAVAEPAGTAEELRTGVAGRTGLPPSVIEAQPGFGRAAGRLSTEAQVGAIEPEMTRPQAVQAAARAGGYEPLTETTQEVTSAMKTADQRQDDLLKYLRLQLDIAKEEYDQLATDELRRQGRTKIQQARESLDLQVGTRKTALKAQHRKAEKDLRDMTNQGIPEKGIDDLGEEVTTYRPATEAETTRAASLVAQLQRQLNELEEKYPTKKPGAAGRQKPRPTKEPDVPGAVQEKRTKQVGKYRVTY
jgi:hypothetical protein